MHTTRDRRRIHNESGEDRSPLAPRKKAKTSSCPSPTKMTIGGGRGGEARGGTGRRVAPPTKEGEGKQQRKKK